MKIRAVWVAALAAAMISPVGAQQYVYPAKGQSAQQQKSDEAACYQWAVQQTGFDPAKAQAPAAPPTTATGTTPGAGARGAVPHGHREHAVETFELVPRHAGVERHHDPDVDAATVQRDRQRAGDVGQPSRLRERDNLRRCDQNLHFPAPRLIPAARACTSPIPREESD